ncbi:MAG: T9SS type A sorting domain-containing protein [Bacteroidetes bacterium]|nr:T9SS type A sorting domain-containing protein [Bacteroidota bacterium]
MNNCFTVAPMRNFRQVICSLALLLFSFLNAFSNNYKVVLLPNPNSGSSYLHYGCKDKTTPSDSIANVGTILYGKVPANPKPWLMVFVHGFASSANTMIGNFYKEAYNDGYRTAFIQLDPYSPSSYNSNILQQAILKLAQDHNFTDLSTYFHSRIIMVCHSKGGLDTDLTLFKMAQANPNYPQLIKRVFPISSPFWGTNTASLGLSFGPLLQLFPGDPNAIANGGALNNLTNSYMLALRKAIDINVNTAQKYTKCKFVSLRGWCAGTVESGIGDIALLTAAHAGTNYIPFKYGYGTNSLLPHIWAIYPILNDGVVPLQSSFRPGGIEMPNSRLSLGTRFNHFMVVPRQWNTIDSYITNNVSSADDGYTCFNYGTNFYQGYDDNSGSYQGFYMPNDKINYFTRWYYYLQCNTPSFYKTAPENADSTAIPDNAIAGDSQNATPIKSNYRLMYDFASAGKSKNYFHVEKENTSIKLVIYSQSEDVQNSIVVSSKGQAYTGLSDIVVLNQKKENGLYFAEIKTSSLPIGKYSLQHNGDFMAFVHFENDNAIELATKGNTGFEVEYFSGELIRLVLKTNSISANSISANLKLSGELPEEYYTANQHEIAALKNKDIPVVFFPTGNPNEYECIINKYLTPAIYSISIDVENQSLNYARSLGYSFSVLPNGDQHGSPLLIENASFAANTSLRSFPNPFNESTTIVFSGEENKNYEVVITDIAGKEVFNSAIGLLQDGVYQLTWKGTTNSNEKLSKGVYICNVKEDGTVVTQPIKLILN